MSRTVSCLVQVRAGQPVSKPMVPAGTPEVEGTGLGQQANTAVAFLAGLMTTGLLWGTGLSARPGEGETGGQGRTGSLLSPGHVAALTLALWLPMGPKPSMPLGTTAAWPRSRGRGVAPTCRSCMPAKAPVGGGYREAHSKCFQITFLECAG